MKTIQSCVSILCVLTLLAPAGMSQQSVSYTNGSGNKRGFVGWLTGPYRPEEAPPINLANSNRLESLLRAGKLYLSLQDTIALALENSLDIELQRYGPLVAEASLLRAKAGGLLRGVPSAVQQGPVSAQAQAVGGATGAGREAGGGGGGGAGAGAAAAGGGGAGGTIITATGVAFQNLDPVFVTTYGWGHRTRPQANTVTTGTTALAFDTNSWSSGIQQGFLTGTTVSFGWNNDWFKSNNVRSDLNPAVQSNFQLQVTQRLLQGFGIAVNNRNIRAAKLDQRVSDLVFRRQLIETVSAVINLYLDLVTFNEDVKVKRQALALAERLYNDNKKQVEIGTLAPIEVVSAEAQVARRQQELTNSETVLLQQETILKNALSRNGVASPTLADARIIPTDPIRIPEKDPVQPIQDLIEMAMGKRPDLEQTRLNIEKARIGLAGSKSQLLPSLDVQASFQNNGLAGTANRLSPGPVPIPRDVDPFFVGGFGTTMGQLFRRNYPDYSIGFQFNIPIRNRQAQADIILDQLNIRQAEIQQQKQLNQVRVEVQNALIALQQARARYQAAVKERVLQEQTLDAEQKKYALGASTVFFVIQYQRDLAQAQSAEVAAMSSYAKAQVELHRVTAQTLEVNNIEIAEARSGRVSRAPSPLPPPTP